MTLFRNIAFCVTLCVANACQGAIDVSIDSSVLAPGDTTGKLTVVFSGNPSDEAVQGYDLTFDFLDYTGSLIGQTVSVDSRTIFGSFLDLGSTALPTAVAQGGTINAVGTYLGAGPTATTSGTQILEYDFSLANPVSSGDGFTVALNQSSTINDANLQPISISSFGTTTVSAVPEPNSIAAIACVGTIAGIYRRRKNKMA
ncbi:hypothetical protein [Crateriforma conspicua]|uniref:PEP-CTERM protein-sorting domain-containing protein n=1 Tax=Crateriforma conspicua TaxID=2527996 RepID=A0A5C6FHJ7_9PLAN|nr:hypothetical protein [Crateriforma conspicua]TWU59669.1 hypothetical protein V7x_54430 [Crateriforma conspicua]